jgi:hypothetical protein
MVRAALPIHLCEGRGQGARSPPARQPRPRRGDPNRHSAPGKHLIRREYVGAIPMPPLLSRVLVTPPSASPMEDNPQSHAAQRERRLVNGP